MKGVWGNLFLDFKEMVSVETRNVEINHFSGISAEMANILV